MDFELNRDDRIALLKLARQTLEAMFDDRAGPELGAATGPLGEYRGAFVTLTIDGRLRGCIGHVEGVQALWQSVRDNAISAAVRDPRFPPLRADELDRVAIEISVLSVLKPMADPLQVEVGTHGLLVERAGRRGLLLPQVATSYGWDAVTFLDHTCRKAGFEPGCWRSSGTTVYAFTAEHFDEGLIVPDCD